MRPATWRWSGGCSRPVLVLIMMQLHALVLAMLSSCSARVKAKRSRCDAALSFSALTRERREEGARGGGLHKS
eukprot:1837217-Rhodomonas_salina.1